MHMRKSQNTQDSIPVRVLRRPGCRYVCTVEDLRRVERMTAALVVAAMAHRLHTASHCSCIVGRSLHQGARLVHFVACALKATQQDITTMCDGAISTNNTHQERMAHGAVQIRIHVCLHIQNDVVHTASECDLSRCGTCFANIP
jgi:hypothetical protein